jgi:GntR family transcriptional regulator
MKLSIDHADPAPLHVKVERLVRRLAARADHATHGKPLPGEVELSNRLGVSRATVRQAMSRLVSEGLLERKRNAGTRVASRPLVTSLTDWHSFTAEMTRRGVSLKSLRIEASVRSAPAHVTEFFRVATKTKCLRLIRIRGDEAGPVVRFESWLHPRLRLVPTDDFSQPLYELIERRAGVVPETSQEQIGAIVADTELAGVIDCSTGDPLLTRERRVCDAGGRGIEFCACVYRADRFTYSIELRRRST